MQVLKSTYQYQNTISKNAKDTEDLKNFSQWNFLLSHFFTIEKQILSIEFQKDRVIIFSPDFLWFQKRFSISYSSIINVLMKLYNITLIEKYDTIELKVPEKYLKNSDIDKSFIIDKSKKWKIELFLQFIEYIDFFKIETDKLVNSSLSKE